MYHKSITLLMSVIMATLLCGCSHESPELSSPCRHYGSTCHQIPINIPQDKP